MTMALQILVLTDIQGPKYFLLFEQPKGEKGMRIFLHLLQALFSQQNCSTSICAQKSHHLSIQYNYSNSTPRG